MRCYLFVFFNFLLFTSLLNAWSWTHSIKIDRNLSDYIKQDNFLQWTKSKIPAFSQLIFSWNAFRSTNGYFSFWVRVRDSKTKKWYTWHHMADWGKDEEGNILQRSFESKKFKGTKFHYVRLELPKNSFADSFKIKVKLHKQAKVSDLKQITVNTINLKKFVSEIKSSYIYNLPSIKISKVPKQSQMILGHRDAKVMCSPTSTAMLLGFLNSKLFDPVKVAQGVYDHGLGVYGSWPFNAAHAFELSNGQTAFHIERLESFKTLHNYLDQGMPVIVSIRGPIKGGATPYAGGHLILVIGYDNVKRRVLCHDPAFENNLKTLKYYKLKDFLQAWEKSFRLAYVPVRN